MAKSGVEIRGLRELVKSLEKAGVGISDLKDAFSAISTKASRLASSFAPSRTGRLKASIKGNKSKNKAVVKAGGARVPWAGAINYGWKKQNIRPVEFMQRGDEAIRPDVIPMIQQNISSIVEENGL